MRQFSQTELSNEREFSYLVFQSSVYGAFFAAIQSRKQSDHLTQSELAARAGKDKTAISKLISSPRNWTLKTISNLCVALDLEMEFRLRDLNEPGRFFGSDGEQIEAFTSNIWFHQIKRSERLLNIDVGDFNGNQTEYQQHAVAVALTRAPVAMQTNTLVVGSK